MLKLEIIEQFKKIVPKENFSIQEEVLYVYGADAGIHHHLPEAVIQPQNTNEIVEIVKICQKNKIPIIPRGAGTALCGHVVPIKGGIILDFQKMNKILEINVKDLYCIIEPGVIYQTLNNALNPFKFFFAPDPGSGEVCTIGGMVAANASGQQAVKYGATRDYVLGLEIVNSFGEIINLGTKTIKDTSGYQLAKLMVGSEGTLGIITKITLKLTPLPETTASAMAIFDKLEQAALCVSKIISIPLIPSQLELMDNICIKAVNKASKMGLPEVEAILLIGVDGSSETVKNDIEKVIKVCQDVGAKEVKFTQKKEEEAKIWASRKAMIPSLSRYIEDKVCVSLADDMAVPMSKIPEIVKAFHQIAKKYNLLIPTYGHAGDGNLHTKFILDSNSKEEWEKAEKAIEEMYDAVFSLGGTTTGEHGSGITKAPLMQKERKDSLQIMHAIKKAFDPNNIMNPNKMMDWQGSFITDLRYKKIDLDEKNPLSKWKKELDTCTYCGFCKSVCPVFENTYWDTETARGKVLNAYGLLTGELKANENIAQNFYNCTQCKDCYRRCPSKIKVPEIIQDARTYLVEQGTIFPIHQTLIKKIENTKNIFGENDLNFPEQEGEILLFIGCQYLSRTNKTKMYIKILEKLGIKVKIKKEICCGFSIKNLGFEKNFEKHKQQFSSMMQDENIITLCPTCTVFLKEEYKLKPKHILEVILEKIPNKNDSKPKVTYHDPCDFSRSLGLIEEPRKIIKKLGYDLVEMEYSKNTSRCCGGGGGMLISNPLLVEKISENRIEQALKTNAKFLITSCPTCEQVLKTAATKIEQKGKGNIEIMDIREILWKEIK